MNWVEIDDGVDMLLFLGSIVCFRCARPNFYFTKEEDAIPLTVHYALVDPVFHTWGACDDEGPGMAVMTSAAQPSAHTRTAVIHDYLYTDESDDYVGLEVRALTLLERDLLRDRVERHIVKFGNVAQERVLQLLA